MVVEIIAQSSFSSLQHQVSCNALKMWQHRRVFVPKQSNQQSSNVYHESHNVFTIHQLAVTLDPFVLLIKFWIEESINRITVYIIDYLG